MLTANNNDILFDDLALINLLGRSGQSATIPIMYGDCNNRYETCTPESHYPGGPTRKDDILFDDVKVIKEKLGQDYLQATVANANCDCGR